MKSIDDKTMQQRLYDILKMNIKLARANNELSTITPETYKSFEEATRNIDEYNQQEYEKELSQLFNTTITLIEEKDRLEKLIELISKRIEERNKLLSEYEEITSKTLGGLSSSSEELELDTYKQRLANIKEYLENKKNIENIELELEHLNKELADSQEQKLKDEEKNYDLEDAIFIKFKNILLGSEENADIIDAIDVDFEIEKLAPKIDENRKTLDIFEKAFCNLAKSGISDEKEVEYSTYVSDAKEAYYQLKEKEILLKLYKLICNTENEYSKLYNKREEIEKLLSYRMDLRRELNITKADLLVDFYKIIDEQESQIRLEKINIERISKTIDKIEFKEKKLESYKEANQKSGILAILQEYGIIETHDDAQETDAIIEPVVEEVKEDPPQVSFGDFRPIEVEESKSSEEKVIYVPNAIKNVQDVPENINVSFVRNKANTVMRRVGKALGIDVPKIEIAKVSKNLDKEDTLDATSTQNKQVETNVVKKPIVNPVSVEEIIPNNINPLPINHEQPKSEEKVSVELPKMKSTFSEPVLELPKEDIFANATNNVKKAAQIEAKVQPQVVPFPMPVLETPKPEIKKEENNDNSGLFWPKTNLMNSSNNDMKNSDFFPTSPVTDGKDFNPQKINSTNEFEMPEIPIGNINLGPGPGQISNSNIKFRKMA